MEDLRIVVFEGDETGDELLEQSLRVLESDLGFNLTIHPFDLSLEQDRKSTRLNSSHGYISYAAFCSKKKTPPPTSFRACIKRLLPYSESFPPARRTDDLRVGRSTEPCRLPSYTKRRHLDPAPSPRAL